MTYRLPLMLATAMQDALDRNAFKAGWENMTPLQLLARADQELGELRRAVAKVKPAATVLAEAADVANFVAMAAAVYHAQAVQDALDAGTT